MLSSHIRFRQSYTVNEAGCWIWRTVPKRRRYASFFLNGKRMQAHRASLFLMRGKVVPIGMEVLHKCDVSICVNPDHLVIGTHADNMADMKAKGRARAPAGDDHWTRRERDRERAASVARKNIAASHKRGSENANSKLCHETANAIRAARELDPTITFTDLGRKFGVGRETARKVVRGDRMGMKIIECLQGSPEWHAARCGRVTASRVADIMRTTKSGVSASRNTYLGELVAERLSGVVAEGFKSKAMEWGNETEEKARDFYAFMRNIEPVAVGLVIHPTIEMAAASPDRLIGDDGLLEVKCPNSATHIATLRGAPIDPDYIKQMQWQMACTERDWCDWVSFDPRLPPDMQMVVRRVKRDPVLIADMQRAVTTFLQEVDEAIADLVKRFRTVAEAAE